MDNKLYRSKADRMVFGVCGGIAEYFKIDSTLVRILAILLLLSGSWVVVLYILLAIVIPENPSQKKVKPVTKISSNSMVMGLGLVVIGIILLLSNYNLLDWNVMWPTILVFIGVYLLWQNKSKTKK